jgi:SAM-dependent methyltransferase
LEKYGEWPDASFGSYFHRILNVMDIICHYTNKQMIRSSSSSLSSSFASHTWFYRALHSYLCLSSATSFRPLRSTFRSTSSSTVLMSYKLDSPSAQRNKEAIWSVLETKVFAENKNELRVLEIAAGVGVHSHYFCQQLQAKQNFETIQWFPTDPREESRRSIEAYRTDVSEILQAPLALTLNEHGVVEDLQELEKKTFDLIVCINMIHISPWEATVGLMKAAQRLLKPGSGILYCYGPYKEGGTAVESNLYVSCARSKCTCTNARNQSHILLSRFCLQQI